MTRRESFNAAEWALLGDAPLAAGAAVALASPGGGRSEAAAMLKGWRAAGEHFAQIELGAEIVAWLDPERRTESGGARYAYASIVEEAVYLCDRAVALLRERATPEELDAYREFVINLAEHVAWAHNEAGLFGVAAQSMSLDERAMMSTIARALGYGRP